MRIVARPPRCAWALGTTERLIVTHRGWFCTFLRVLKNPSITWVALFLFRNPHKASAHCKSVTRDHARARQDSLGSPHSIPAVSQSIWAGGGAHSGCGIVTEPVGAMPSCLGHMNVLHRSYAKLHPGWEGLVCHMQHRCIWPTPAKTFMSTTVFGPTSTLQNKFLA